jgi:hypothetical protein
VGEKFLPNTRQSFGSKYRRFLPCGKSCFSICSCKENDNDETLFLNSRGISIRGRLANKIGFAAYVTDNQERDPLYVQQFEKERKAVPGVGYYKYFKGTAMIILMPEVTFLLMRQNILMLVSAMIKILLVMAIAVCSSAIFRTAHYF